MGATGKRDTNGFDSYRASSMGKSPSKEQEWRLVFIKAREIPFSILWKESSIVLKCRDFRVHSVVDIASLDVKLGESGHVNKRNLLTNYCDCILNLC